MARRSEECLHEEVTFKQVWKGVEVTSHVVNSMSESLEEGRNIVYLISRKVSNMARLWFMARTGD